MHQISACPSNSGFPDPVRQRYSSDAVSANGLIHLKKHNSDRIITIFQTVTS
jgi:hypothetical protein